MSSMFKRSFAFMLVMAFGCDVEGVDNVEKNDERVEADADAEPLKQLEAAQPDDESENDQFSEEAAELSLSMAPDPSASGVCCALCWNRWNYYQMVGVTQNCAYWASAWCSQNGRGGLEDAAWGSCNPPPGGF